MNSGLSRRRFLLQATEGITAAIFLPSADRSAKSLREARLGVVGLGQRGRVLISMCGAHGPAAICDINPEALRSAQAAYPGMPAFVSYERMLRESAAEAVAVATPHPAGLVEAALASGKHVFLASPRGVTVEAAKRIAASVERSGLDFAVAPFDLSWDTEGLGRIFDSLRFPKSGRMRLNVTASTWDPPASEGRIDWVGRDVLSQAVRLAPRARVPRRVQAVVAPGRMWSVGLVIDDSTSVEIHTSVDRGLTPGAFVIEFETPQQYGRSRAVITSEPQALQSGPDAGAGIGLQRFLQHNADRYTVTEPEWGEALRGLEWSSMFTEALERNG